MAEECTRIRGDVLDSLSPNKQMLIIQQPVGIVGAVTPWNFPANMIMRKVAPALAAGCPVSISQVLIPNDFVETVHRLSEMLNTMYHKNLELVSWHSKLNEL